jgi:glycosyltransferase involved in cell wall biosynthesis
LKIAVVSIALNEKQFVKPWLESAEGADYRIIGDTGSTDGTVALAKKLGATVHNLTIKPWRFDDARNALLALVPADADYVINLDLDEVLVTGWREELEKVKPETTRPRYKYTWSWKEDGTEGLTYGGDKIVKRNGYRWKHPVHEVMVADRIEEVQEWIGLEIHHHADNTKPRSQYLPLLAQAVAEDPYDDRNTFYYARELYFYGKYEEATIMFQKHLELPRAVWPPERAASMRYLGKMASDGGEYWFKRAASEAPGRREPHVDLAKHYYNVHNWPSCLEAAEDALKIQEKPLEYLCEEEAWGYLPWDLAALASYHVGNFDKALGYNRIAIALDPENERLKTNDSYYRQALPRL